MDFEALGTCLTTPACVVSVVNALVDPFAREPRATGRSMSSRPSLVSAMFETSVLMGASASTFTLTVSVCVATFRLPSMRTVCLEVSTRFGNWAF